MAQVNPGPKSTADSSAKASDRIKDLGTIPGRPRSVFRGWSLVLFWVVMFLFAFHSSTHMVAAGDTWVGLACGRHFVNHGVDTVDPFSFNSHPAGPTEESIKQWPQWAQTLCKPFSIETIRYWHPTGWINQNWLTHVMFYWLAEKFGTDGQYNYNSLVYWKFALYFLDVIVIYLFARTIGASVPGSAAAASFAMFVGRTFFDIRPACFANLMAPLFLLVLALAVYRNIRYIWLLIPVTVFWANVHGGYIYIFIMLVPFVLIHLLANLPKKWTLCACSCLLWLVLFGLARQFSGNDLYKEIYKILHGVSLEPASILSDGGLWLILILIGGCVALTIRNSIPSALRTTYSIAASIVVFMVLIIRFMISIPDNLSTETLRRVQSFIGGFQFTFVIGFAVIVAGSILLIAAKNRLVQVSNRKVGWVMAAAATSFIAMVLLNPFHLTNLTHTFEISISKHAASWRSVNEWRPAFNWMDPTSQPGIPNPVGDEEAFGVLCILALLAAAVWIATRWIKAPKTSAILQDRSGRSSASIYTLPKIDIAMIAIVALTMVMAIRSRRFIPIAASAACPLLVLMFEQAMLAFTARRQAGITGKFALPECPDWLRNSLIGLAGLILIVFGGYTFGKYKQIYLDPWLPDGHRDSVFMRMTASNVKPFDAGQFIRDNRLAGNMFNYWTEGGAIAFFQEPDPETGKTPLQLFMDGRAQAAYNIDKFDLWRLIKGGGPVMQKLAMAGKPLTDQDFRQVGQWINQELAKYKVWVILMPVSEVPYPGIPSKDVVDSHYFIRALQMQGNWIPAFVDDFQYLYVRNDTPEGKELLRKIFLGEAKFPNEFSRNLTLASLYLQTGNEENLQKAFEHAKAAFVLEPNQASALRMVYEIRRYPSVRRQAEQVLQAFLDDFLTRQKEYAKQGGYCNRLVAARITANGLIVSIQASDPTRAQRYQEFFQKTDKLPSLLSQEAKW